MDEEFLYRRLRDMLVRHILNDMGVNEEHHTHFLLYMLQIYFQHMARILRRARENSDKHSINAEDVWSAIQSYHNQHARPPSTDASGVINSRMAVAECTFGSKPSTKQPDVREDNSMNGDVSQAIAGSSVDSESKDNGGGNLKKGDGKESEKEDSGKEESERKESEKEENEKEESGKYGKKSEEENEEKEMNQGFKKEVTKQDDETDYGANFSARTTNASSFSFGIKIAPTATSSVSPLGPTSSSKEGEKVPEKKPFQFTFGLKSNSDDSNSSKPFSFASAIAAKSEETAGLLDKPVEITGRRARKQVNRLEVSFSTQRKPKLEPKKKQKIAKGSGQKLGKCPRIEFQISKHSVADLKPLHVLLYSRPGSAHDMKKNIRKFSGFDFSKNSPKFEHKRVSMERFTSNTLKGICEILDLKRGGIKDDIIMRIMEFLLEPKDPGKSLPKKSSIRDKKRTSGKKAKTTEKRPKAKSDDDDASNESEEDAGNDEEEEKGNDVESKKKSKNVPKRKTPSKTKAVKKEKPKKESHKGIKRKRDNTSDSSEDEQFKKIPSDEEIKKLVKQILDNADWHKITKRNVIKQVYNTYPECDLRHKKAFIKMTIRSIVE